MAKIPDSQKPVGIWLLIGALMIVIQIVLGGITRLTGSGLSITEWKPLLGSIPPLNEQEWQQSFKQYQAIAQYKQLNSHFNLTDFKFIYFWEWFHRLWARVLGLAFIIPFTYFAVRGHFNNTQKRKLIILFLLGGIQGLLGWIMVKSGLNETDLYVNHIKLAIHFMTALVLLAYTFWYGLELLIKEPQIECGKALKSLNVLILITLNIQLVYGAFMAGMKAGVHAPTWPDINGSLFPQSIGERSSIWHWIYEPLSIHFIHRNLAYLLTLMIGIWTYMAFRRGIKDYRTKFYFRIPFILALAQVALGVFATVTSYKAIPQGWGKFEWSAQLHQLVAILLLMSLIANQYLMKVRKEDSLTLR